MVKTSIERITKISCLSLFESTIEQHGLYRIEWNKKWLENTNISI